MDLEMDPDLELTPPTWSNMRHRWDCSQRWSGLSKIATQILIWRWIQIWTWPPHDLRWAIDGTAARDGVDPQKLQLKYGSGDGSRFLTWPPHDLRWDIYGTAARDGVDPQELQLKYGSWDGSRSRVDPPHDLRWDIDGTAARDGVDSQKLQPKYGSGDGSRSGLDLHMI